MQPQKKTWLAINVVGGAAVLGSYVHGLATHPDTRDQLWGSIPPELQAVYGVTMWLAAAGYFFFSYYFLARTEVDEVRFGRFGFGLINALYALVMVPSALWMPLTFAYLEDPSPGLWLIVRADLLLVAVGSIGAKGVGVESAWMTAVAVGCDCGAGVLTGWAAHPARNVMIKSDRVAETL